MRRIYLASVLSCALAACGAAGDGGPINVAVIGDQEALFADGVRLSPSAQHLRSATNEGLVALDPVGQVIPAIAERWIVTDDGLSYIFRLRASEWPDGEEITAAQVRLLLQERLRVLDGTSLGLDLEKITDIRAMTGRVVELRLSGPMPDFLRLLAQPELGFANKGSGAGPMRMSRDQDLPLARLSALAPQDRGLPSRKDWVENSRSITLRAMSASAGVEAFSNGEIDLLLNGTIADFPMAQVSPLSRGTVQVDPTIGLFGLVVKSDEGVLSDPTRREALSMAIDRADLIAPFGLGGWQQTQWVVPPQYFSSLTYPAERWGGLTLEERRAAARSRIASWESANDEEAVLRIGLPPGPGSELLYERISEHLRDIGVTTVRVGLGEGAELELVDRLARYSSPRWFLNQLNCSLTIGLCSGGADELVAESISIKEVAAKEELLREAHEELIAAEVFIPFGVPVRWSLVRGAVDGYQANQWGMHPLFPLAQPTT